MSTVAPLLCDEPHVRSGRIADPAAALLEICLKTYVLFTRPEANITVLLHRALQRAAPRQEDDMTDGP
jgi:hypothetical protein